MYSNNKAEEITIKSRQDVYYESKRKLDELIGLDDVKREIIQLLSIRWTFNMATLYDNKCKKSHNHIAFIGNNGTGRIDVAKIISGLYYGTEILVSQYFRAINMDQIEDINSSEMLGSDLYLETNLALEDVKNNGGTLFIDQFQKLIFGENDTREYREKILSSIASYINLYGERFALIVAGVSEQAREPINRSVIIKDVIKNMISFPDNYQEEQLFEMFKSMAKREGRALNKESEEYLKSILHYFAKKGSRLEIGPLYQRAVMFNASKIFNKLGHISYEEVKKEEFMDLYLTITADDIKNAYTRLKEDELYSQTKNKTLGFIQK